jgi:hypothetical protein
LIDVKELRGVLGEFLNLPNNKIIIKRKKKIVLEETPNGSVKSKRRNIIKIEIIE